MRQLISIVIFCVIAGVSHAQQAGSPYSIYGVGIPNDQGVTYNTMKGGLGISNGNSYILNNINPALLPLNTFTIFDFGMQYEQRRLSKDSLNTTGKGGGLSYVALSVPLKAGKWTMSLGLRPYSSVKYDFVSRSGVANDTTAAVYNYESDGGLNEIHLQTGARVLKSLFVGAKASYLFGSITSETRSTPMLPNTALLQTAYFRSNNSNGFLFGLGAVYNKQIKEKTYVNLGVVYDFQTNLNTTRDEWLSSSSNRVDVETADTLEVIMENVDGKIRIPQKLGVGLSFTKEFKWTVGFDFYHQNWSDYQNFFGDNENLQSSTKYILGGEYTPDFFSVNSYLKRVTFMAGVNYTKTPISIENEDINDFGINFGASLPITNGSTVNLGFTIGSMGTTSNNLVKENYYKISLGISFNDQAYGWYRKQRKFN